eukprot:492314_1
MSQSEPFQAIQFIMYWLYILFMSTVAGSNQTVSLDVISIITTFARDADRMKIRLLNNPSKEIVEDCYMNEIEQTKSIITNLNSPAFDDECQKLNKVFSNHNSSLYFRKLFDKQLPEILTIINGKNLSHIQQRQLLFAMNKSIGIINENDNIRLPHLRRINDALGRVSLLLIGHYIKDFWRAPWNMMSYMIDPPFRHLIGCIFFKTVIESGQVTINANTILWDEETIKNISNEIIQQHSGTYQIGLYSDWFLFQNAFWPDFHPYPKRRNEFWTECIVKISDIYDDKNINLTFKYDDWYDSGSWIELVTDLAVYHHKNNNTGKFKKMIHSLCTIFFDMRSDMVEFIYKIQSDQETKHAHNYVVIPELMRQCQQGWRRHPLIHWAWRMSVFATMLHLTTLVITYVSLGTIMFILISDETKSSGYVCTKRKRCVCTKRKKIILIIIIILVTTLFC